MRKFIKLLKRTVSSFLHIGKNFSFAPFLKNGLYDFKGDKLLPFSFKSFFCPSFYVNDKYRIKTKDKILMLKGGQIAKNSKSVLIVQNLYQQA